MPPRNVLYLVHRLPYPPDKGDRIRAFHLLKYLARRSAVHLACLADEPAPEESLAVLNRLCARLAVVPLGRWSRWLWAAGSLLRGRTVTEGVFHSRALVTILCQWAKETRFHVTLASASSMVPYQRLPELREVPAVVDLVDVDSQKWLDYATAGDAKAALYRLEGRRLRRLEQDLPRWTRAVTLVSDAEADLYRRFCSWDGVYTATNGVELDYFRPPQAAPAENGCVFVGALDYRPNVDAACWFCHEVWPAVRSRCPAATLRLIGRQPVAAVLRLAAIPGVEVVGQVHDVRPFVAEAAVAVVPLRLARGLQNKVLEALAMAKPVVASPPALAGLGNRDVPVRIAATPAEWVEQIVSLLENDGLRRRLGAAGRRYVEEHHNWDRCLEPFGDLLGLATEHRSFAGQTT